MESIFTLLTDQFIQNIEVWIGRVEIQRCSDVLPPVIYQVLYVLVGPIRSIGFYHLGRKVIECNLPCSLVVSPSRRKAIDAGSELPKEDYMCPISRNLIGHCWTIERIVGDDSLGPE